MVPDHIGCLFKTSLVACISLRASRFNAQTASSLALHGRANPHWSLPADRFPSTDSGSRCRLQSKICHTDREDHRRGSSRIAQGMAQPATSTCPVSVALGYKKQRDRLHDNEGTRSPVERPPNYSVMHTWRTSKFSWHLPMKPALLAIFGGKFPLLKNAQLTDISPGR